MGSKVGVEGIFFEGAQSWGKLLEHTVFMATLCKQRSTYTLRERTITSWIVSDEVFGRM